MASVVSEARSDMDMDKMTQVLAKLIDRTQEGKLKWTSATSSNSFHAILGELTVAVSALGLAPFLAERYQLVVMGKRGKTIQLLHSGIHLLHSGDGEALVSTSTDYVDFDSGIATGEQARELERLYELARRSAFDTDSTLDELVHQLDAIR